MEQLEISNAGIKTVALPVELHEFKGAIGVGLYALYLGKAEIKLMDSTIKKCKARFVLSAKAIETLEIINTSFTQQDIFYSALLWLSKQPSHILNTKL